MTLKELYEHGRKALGDSFEAEILCAEFLGVRRKEIIVSPEVVHKNPQHYLRAVEKRMGGAPLQYILGHWLFDGLDLKVREGVLIPREDTLPLVVEAAEFIGNKSFKGFDLCSGTGAVALGITNRCKNAAIEAVELYEQPLSCLKENIKLWGRGRVTALALNVLTESITHEGLDFIVSNPPYIESGEIPTLQEEVQREPHTALDGGIDGLVFYRVICQKWAKALRQGGLLAVEIGDTQGSAVESLFAENGFSDIRTVKDFNGLPRVVRGILG